MAARYPPLTGLRTFEAAARHLSFTRAGDELAITQAAVSQQIKLLESRLGFALFHRMPRKLALTEEGVQLAATLSQSLTQIADTIGRLRASEAGGVLTVSTLPSFAMKWMIPRLGDFKRAHPAIDLRVHASDTTVDLYTDGVDVAIRYNPEPVAGLTAVALMRDEVFPVCSPALLEGGPPLRSPDDLRYHTLIHDEADRSGVSGLDWGTWCTAVGADIDTRGGLSFWQGDMVVQAAIEGQGVAITRTTLAQYDIEAGRLVRLFDSHVLARGGYALVCPVERAGQPKVRALREWLLAQAELSQPD